jgi:hypothetical protein
VNPDKVFGKLDEDDSRLVEGWSIIGDKQLNEMLKK